MRANGEISRTNLLEAGLRLFAERGFAATSIKDVTDTAGLPKGSFYNYFASKEDFSSAVVELYGERLDRAWQSYLANGPDDPLAALRYAFECKTRWHEHNGCYSGCLVGTFAVELSEHSKVSADTLHLVSKRSRLQLELLLERAQQNGTVRFDLPAAQLAEFFWSAWEGAILQMKIEHSVAPLRACVNGVLDHLFRP